MSLKFSVSSATTEEKGEKRNSFDSTSSSHFQGPPTDVRLGPDKL